MVNNTKKKQVKKSTKVNETKKIKNKNILMQNPSKTLWGKIIIWILASFMILGTLATLIYVLYNNLTNI